MPVTRIGPIGIATLSRADAIALAQRLIDDRSFAMLAFCNAHSVNLARDDAAFAAAMDRAVVLNDGLGVDIARRLLVGSRFPDNLNGTDFTPALIDSATAPLRIFLLGGKPGIADRAADALARRFPRHQVVGTQHGYFDPGDTPDILRRIAAARADIVLVGMGQPLQEKWVVDHATAIATVWLCIGAYLDFLAGAFPRAPLWIRRLRAEWIFRLMLEPRRLARRYLFGNGRFVLNIVNDILAKK